jgi:uncharacterized protein
MAETGNMSSCDIMIDRNGVWYYRGAEMFRKEIVYFFYEHLKRDETGRYLIELDDDRCYVDVEDTAFVVHAVYRTSTNGEYGDSIDLLLSDGTREALNAKSMRIGKSEIPYCTVKNQRFEARFSRAAYYQLAAFIAYDDERDAYYIDLHGQRTYIQRSRSEAEEREIAC